MTGRPGLRRWVVRLAAVFIAPALLLGAPAPAKAESVMRLIAQADLKNLDPVWTTAAITQNHGYMVYDTLFALDSHIEPKPQMVDTWTTSPDGLIWTFTLRDGLMFQDGSPVTARDVVASLTRWAKRMSDGQTMMSRAASLTAKDDKTFELVFKEKFGPVLQVLANPAQPPFIMREKEALTDPFEQVKEVVGSGPFIFAKDEWEPGHKVVYRKFAGYKPRPEPSDGLAGGKVVHLDKVEWLYIPDTAIATQALISGEADAYELPPYDLLPLLEQHNDITIKALDPFGRMGQIRPNFLYPPFNNEKARQALALLVDQKDYLAAMVGNPKYERECYSMFLCGTPLSTDAYSEPYRKADIEKAKQLFKEAGYNGEPVVVLDPTDQQVIHNISSITAAQLRAAGVNVDLQSMDWSTLTSRRPSKNEPGKGGWNIFTTWQFGYTLTSPLVDFPMVTSCDGKNWFGWPCDEESEKLRQAFLSAGTLDEQKQAVAAIQKRAYEFIPLVNTGQFMAPAAWRNDRLVNVPNALIFAAWNIEKK